MFANSSSPIEFLTAFAITFAAGVASTLIIQAYGRTQRNAAAKKSI